MQSVLTALVVLLSILAASNLLLTLALARRLAATERTVAANSGGEPRRPQVGADIGTFSAQTVKGVPLTDNRLRSGLTLLVFSLAGCAPCADLAEELGRTELPTGLDLIVLVAAREDDQGAVTAVRYPAWAEVAFLPPDSGLIDRLGIGAFPTVALVEEGRITGVGRHPGEVLAALTKTPA